MTKLNQLYVAGVIDNDNRAAIGCIIKTDLCRNRHARYYGICELTPMAEAEALLYGLKQAEAQGLQRLEIYTQNLQVFDYIYKGVMSVQINGHDLLLHQSYHKLRTVFSAYTVHLVDIDTADSIMEELNDTLYDILNRVENK